MTLVGRRLGHGRWSVSSSDWGIVFLLHPPRNVEKLRILIFITDVEWYWYNQLYIFTINILKSWIHNRLCSFSQHFLFHQQHPYTGYQFTRQTNPSCMVQADLSQLPLYKLKLFFDVVRKTPVPRKFDQRQSLTKGSALSGVTSDAKFEALKTWNRKWWQWLKKCHNCDRVREKKHLGGFHVKDFHICRIWVIFCERCIFQVPVVVFKDRVRHPLI